MDTDEKSTPPAPHKTPANSSLSIGGDVSDSVIVQGNNNTVNKADSQTFIQKVVNVFTGDTDQQIAQRNRKAMLGLVSNIWVKEVLEQSLYGEILIELGMEAKPGAVERPWDMLLQTTDQPGRPLPPRTPIIQVFDELNGALLILGEPGSGKTTTLLELARDTINRAEQDDTQPIPVVFNLSSWTDPKRPLADWLVVELGNKYFVSKKVAQRWVEQDQLLLLLDGLDEVRLENREAAIRTINDFRQEHGSTKLAVCCRIADYEALGSRLQLWGAVLLQPLTLHQIDEYFDHAGAELSSVRQALQQDTVLQELVRQPLMLSILTLAYRGLPIEALVNEQDTTLEGRRKHLFDAYIRQMFARPARTPNLLYTPEQTMRWLTWLAQRMVGQKQSIFLLEWMNRNWLQSGSQQNLYKMAIMVGTGVSAGLFIWLTSMLVGLIIGLGSGRLVGWLVFGLLYGLPSGLFEGLFAGLSMGRAKSEKPVELITWTWKNVWNGQEGWLDGWLSSGLFGGLFLGALYGFYAGLTGGLVGVVVGGLVGVLLGGLISVEIGIHITPNQGIQHSRKNIVLGAQVDGLSFGLIFGMLGVMLGGWPDVTVVYRWLVGGLLGEWLGMAMAARVFLGLAIGFWGMFLGMLIGGLKRGGAAVIYHYTLRYLLYRQNYMPRDYVRFLDYAAERIFLRKVGGGYIFVHRLLMEHFASLPLQQEKAKR